VWERAPWGCPPRQDSRPDADGNFAVRLAEVEKAHILQTLERCGWNHSRAAEALGIGRTTLWRKLKEYEIE
jgi:sigma-54 dependent transcriptional regulator, acetoin dehydrogenase operon transcriptional activator AcoR